MTGRYDDHLLLHVVAAEVARRQRLGHPVPERLRASLRQLTQAVAEAGQATAACREESEPALPWPDPRGLLTVDEVAQRIGCSPRTVRRLGHRIGGRKIGHAWLFDPRAVAEHTEGLAQ
ncbi:helix-turn-helix domain-containing protein [Nocardia neocaledoniensis]|uniref:helix-turn-helix domain-containing protein n=1 Tax=Nocardia neocaledoniensis TaxID=236511 RepID=UPI00340B898D